MSSELYQQQIKQLAEANYGGTPLKDADTEVTVDNPLCGDRVTLQLSVNEGRVAEISQQVRGCLLCRAAASALAQAAKNISVEEIKSAKDAFQVMLAGGLANTGVAVSGLPGEHWQLFAGFAPVANHKSRHQCVLLPFEACEQALAQLSQS